MRALKSEMSCETCVRAAPWSLAASGSDVSWLSESRASLRCAFAAFASTCPDAGAAVGAVLAGGCCDVVVAGGCCGDVADGGCDCCAGGFCWGELCVGDCADAATGSAS